MKRFLLLLAWFGVLGALPATQPAPAEKELERLQGKWGVVGGQVAGKKLDDKDAAALNWAYEIKGNRLSKFINGQLQAVFSVALDTNKNPKEIDLAQLDGVGAGLKTRGIYALEGDTLKLCLREKLNGRPGKFDLPKGSEDYLLILAKSGPREIVFDRSLVARMLGFAVSPVVRAAVAEGKKKS